MYCIVLYCTSTALWCGVLLTIICCTQFFCEPSLELFSKLIFELILFVVCCVFQRGAVLALYCTLLFSIVCVECCSVRYYVHCTNNALCCPLLYSSAEWCYLLHFVVRSLLYSVAKSCIFVSYFCVLHCIVECSVLFFSILLKLECSPVFYKNAL